MNRFEISESNTFHIRELVEFIENGVILATNTTRRNTDSTQDLSAEPQIIKDLAAVLPFAEITRTDGTHKPVTGVRINPNNLDEINYNITIIVRAAGENTFVKKMPLVKVTKGDDLTSHPAKIQTIAAVLWV